MHIIRFVKHKIPKHAHIPFVIKANCKHLECFCIHIHVSRLHFCARNISMLSRKISSRKKRIQFNKCIICYSLYLRTIHSFVYSAYVPKKCHRQFRFVCSRPHNIFLFNQMKMFALNCYGNVGPKMAETDMRWMNENNQKWRPTWEMMFDVRKKNVVAERHMKTHKLTATCNLCANMVTKQCILCFIMLASLYNVHKYNSMCSAYTKHSRVR